jgi:hypothetical protein
VLYVYAISDEVPSRLGRGRRTVESAGLQVTVGETAAAPAVTPEALQDHDAVVRRLSVRCPALLPARFGWVAADDAEVRAALAPHAASLRASLDLVRGCVQMTLRVFGDTRPAAPAPSAPPGAAASAGTRYLLQRADVLRAAESLPELAPLRAHLAPMLRASREERHDAGGLLGTAYHLVERRRLRAYRAVVRKTAGALSPLRLHVTGPWAPYAFGPRELS